MKYPAIWTRIFLGVVLAPVLIPQTIALPADVSSFDGRGDTDLPWEADALLIFSGLTVLLVAFGLCACGDKPSQISDPTPDGDATLPLQQPGSPGSVDRKSPGSHSPPLPTTPNAPPYQNVQGNGSVPSPPSPTKEVGEMGSPLTRGATIERQLPAIPPSKAGASVGAARASVSTDYDDDYDIIKTGKEPDYDGTYSRVKDKKSPDCDGDTSSFPEDDYAAVDMRRMTAEAGSREGIVAVVPVAPATERVTPPERMAPRAEPEPDISDAEYAVVDMRRDSSAPSTSQGTTEPSEGQEGDKGAVGGGAKPKKGRNHGYAKIDDVRVDNPAVSGGATEGHVTIDSSEQQAGSPVRLSPRTPPATSPSHSAGSPSHQQRLLPDVDDSSLGAVGGQPPSPVPDAQLGEPRDSANGATTDGTKRREPSYSQVSARESLARVRAREQEDPSATQLYQAVDEETTIGAGDDHSDLYESVDYQAVDGPAQPRPVSYSNSNPRSSSNTMPPRRGRVYEEINDRDAARQTEGETANIEPYAVVEPIGRRQTAPSRISAASDSTCSDASDLYAKVDKPPKDSAGAAQPDPSSGGSNQAVGEDFAGLYAKVNKKKKRTAPQAPPTKVQSVDSGAADNPRESRDSTISNGDDMYAEVRKPDPETSGDTKTKGAAMPDPPAVGHEATSPAATGVVTPALDADDSYQSIDDVRANQRIDNRAHEVGMVHIDTVQTGMPVWEKPEHTYASVEETASGGRRGAEVNHEYEVLDKKAAKKAAKQKKKKQSKESKNAGGSPPPKSPTKLNNKQLKALTDKRVKETDI